MNYTNLPKHLLFALFLFLLSAAISWILIKRVKVLDIPNGRSSHSKSTPTIGGLAIVFTFFFSMLLLYIFADKPMITERYFLGFTFSSLLIAGMSLYDDLKQKAVYIRLLTHIVAIIIVMSFGIIIHAVDFGYKILFINSEALGIIGYFMTFWWIIGMINAYNFMDGLNGMAGGNAIIASIFFCIISLSQGSNFTYIVSYTLGAGVLGFLVFNFPKGKLFMGDVGSTFLGFAFAVISIIASLYDNAHTSLLVIPLLFFHFIYDTFFTFLRRLLKKENVFQSHRTHLYQLFNRMGYKHITVTVFYYAVAVAQGIGAMWLVTIPGIGRLFVFIPYLIFQIIYSIIIIIHAKKKDLI
ncbi:MAG: undecaprenyl/decaprenyl-phosphate alpha-N-acetylglucosaminyl 1-phosphate transferase [Proteobacteria bacterium]|nr:undecaprenyl/decaprenyl-phosphate alpha-N-acetylglucosaminyl 1-phosphate transferase [Pseudomonadota bacterium]MBU1697724.1 undecaprenyl/decaprenyl-phosphate alpha-N-acetylglucosaminyl 1-phosphate transferase [Pseudomonadota bacterium]